MTIYDIYETISSTFLSGSMTSNFFVGNQTLTSSISQSRTIYNTNRVLIGDKYSGLPSSSMNTSLFPKWRYSDWVAFTTGSVVKGKNTFYTCQTQNIYYFDSVMPEIISIASLNVEYIYSGSVTWKADLDLQATGFISTSAGNVVIRRDSQWLNAFPFQTKYKHLARIPNQGRLLLVATGSATHLGMVTFEQSTYDQYTIADVTSSNPRLDFGPTYVQATFEDQAGLMLLLPMDLTRKTFFGFGDGCLTKTDQVYGPHKQLPTYLLRSFPDPDFLAGPLFRGFKYGAMNANPISPKYVFSRTQFGQQRNLLESPAWGTVLDNNAIVYAVTVSFLSGTVAYASASVYASASSPTDFNPYDSGHYDIHARAGQPFFDRSGD